MNQQILKHIPQYSVIICMICKEPHCLSLNSLSKHYSTCHRESVSQEQRTALVKYARTLKGEIKDPAAVKLIIPSFEEGPIDGLYKIHGYECKVCKKLLREVSSMEQHCRPHGWRKTPKMPDMWTQKWMQVCMDLPFMTDVLDFLHSNSIPQLFPRRRSRKPSPPD
jgi:hypothetical protein